MDIKDINYIDYGTNKKGTIVLLHGWGQNIEMMDMLGKPFQDNYRIIILDLPGFGKSPEPNEPWSVEDYTACLFEFLKSKKVDNPILVGHSFGGRMSICYAGKYGAEKVVLLAAPFRPQKAKHPNRTKFYKFVKKVKILKPLANYLKKKWGSRDYNAASDINRGTLVKTVNEDLTAFAKNIKCPVIIIHGTLDDESPLTESEELSKIIPDAGLIVYEGMTHYAYLEDLNRTIAIMDSFLNRKD